MNTRMKMGSVIVEKEKKVLTMAKCFAGDHLRFVNGEWRDDNGDAIEISRVRHGRWIHTDLAAHWLGKDECSECTYHEKDRSDLSHFNYCPNCGAKMDGGDGNSDMV